QGVPVLDGRRSRVARARPVHPDGEALDAARGLAPLPSTILVRRRPRTTPPHARLPQGRAPSAARHCVNPPPFRARRLRGGAWTPLVSVTVGSGPHFPGAVGALAGRCRRWR